MNTELFKLINQDPHLRHVQNFLALAHFYGVSTF